MSVPMLGCLLPASIRERYPAERSAAAATFSRVSPRLIRRSRRRRAIRCSASSESVDTSGVYVATPWRREESEVDR
jgi:hypothetical protein